MGQSSFKTVGPSNSPLKRSMLGGSKPVFAGDTRSNTMFFPQQCGHTEGVLTVSVKARCLIEVFSYASGIFPVNFNTKWLL